MILSRIKSARVRCVGRQSNRERKTMKTITMPNYLISSTVKGIATKVESFRAKTQVLTSRGLREVDDIVNSVGYWEIPVLEEKDVAVRVRTHYDAEWDDS